MAIPSSVCEASLVRLGLQRRLQQHGSLRVLGVDVGMKRSGLAVSDDGARIAFPLGHAQAASSPFNNRAWCSSGSHTSLHTPSFAALYQHIRELCVERDVGGIVLGLPLQLDGSRGSACDAVVAFRDGLRRSGLERGLPVLLWDERFSSGRARFELTSVRRRLRERDGQVDGAAATMVLQSFLDTLHSSASEHEPEPELHFDDVHDEKAKNREKYLRRRSRRH